MEEAQRCKREVALAHGEVTLTHRCGAGRKCSKIKADYIRGGFKKNQGMSKNHKKVAH